MKAADLVPLMEALRATAPLDAVVWDGPPATATMPSARSVSR